jgi:hypothetical protein
MDQAKLSYFIEKFDSYDSEELGALVERREGLADEAIEALNCVLEKRGLSGSLLAAFTVAPVRTEKEDGKYVAEQTDLSRELWRGRLAIACQLMMAFTFMAPVQNLLKALTIGALWAGLLVVVSGYSGYRLGRFITKKICSDGDVSISMKKKKLWQMFWVLWPIFFVMSGVSHVLFLR